MPPVARRRRPRTRTSTMSARRFDVVVIGAGPAGLAFALSLAPSGLTVAIVERQPRDRLAQPAFDGREIAMTHASVARLRKVGAWDLIPDDEVSPLVSARVLNGASPRFLDLRDESGNEGLARLVSNHVIRRALFERVDGLPAVTLLTEEQVVAIRPDGQEAHVELESGRHLRARLVVAADSRFSATRGAMGIATRVRDFGRTMCVFRVEPD